MQAVNDSVAGGVVVRVGGAAVALGGAAVAGAVVAALCRGQVRVLQSDGGHGAPGLALPQRRLSPAFGGVDLLRGGRVALPPHDAVEALPLDVLTSSPECRVRLRQPQHVFPSVVPRVALQLPGQELLFDVYQELGRQQ